MEVVGVVLVVLVEVVLAVVWWVGVVVVMISCSRTRGKNSSSRSSPFAKHVDLFTPHTPPPMLPPFHQGAKFDWKTIKDERDKYILRLNGIYKNNLGNSDVEVGRRKGV